MGYKKCAVCGQVIDDKYTFCFDCNKKKQQGIITKCSICGMWHETNVKCPFLYDKKCLMSKSEIGYYNVLKELMPENYSVFPQINLAVFVSKNGNSKYINELFRNVDFLITDSWYNPIIAVEINDDSHNREERIERDEKVNNILEEAGIPLLTLWVKDGIDKQKISVQINELFEKPVERVKHSFKKPLAEVQIENNNEIQNENNGEVQNISEKKPQQKQGCYIATCVYGSYDCPSVWTLRRFRDDFLRKNIFGRCFIKVYYLTSPSMVKLFGNRRLFRKFWKVYLDRLVKYLNGKGIPDTKYLDK